VLQIHVRNTLILAGLIVLLYLMLLFVSGRYMSQRLDGIWVSVCGQSEYVFDSNEYRHSGGDSGHFSVKGNMIHFSNGDAYPINVRLRRSYMILNGIHYLRRD